jgi:hypothetical protein
VIDTIAYIFQMNRLPAGDRELTRAADLNGVELTRPKQ